MTSARRLLRKLLPTPEPAASSRNKYRCCFSLTSIRIAPAAARFLPVFASRGRHIEYPAKRTCAGAHQSASSKPASQPARFAENRVSFETNFVPLSRKRREEEERARERNRDREGREIQKGEAPEEGRIPRFPIVLKSIEAKSKLCMSSPCSSSSIFPSFSRSHPLCLPLSRAEEAVVGPLMFSLPKQGGPHARGVHALEDERSSRMIPAGTPSASELLSCRRDVVANY